MKWEVWQCIKYGMKISLKGVLQYFFIFSEGLVFWGERGVFYILGISRPLRHFKRTVERFGKVSPTKISFTFLENL